MRCRTRLFRLFAPTLCALTPILARELTIDERVEAQRAIEQVFWNHRIWPAQNPSPKPPLSAVLSEADLRARVDETLRQSNALATRWNRPITAAALQAELDRIAASTRDPQMLKELFHALGDDPALIAEALVRPTLAERTIRAAFATDERIQAKASFDAWWSRECVRFDAKVADVPSNITLAAVSGACTNDSWSPTKFDFPDPRFWMASVWTGTEMIVWGGAGDLNTGGRYNPATDSWVLMAQSPSVPAGRALSSAVWTGTEMIVWGGVGVFPALGTGGRYNPSTDTWTPTSNAGAPAARSRHTAVWTGTQMIVWGGKSIGEDVNTGGRYTPATDSWTATSTGANVPTGRSFHSAVWTTTATPEMIVWGGILGASSTNTGGRYNPTTDTWTPTSASGAVAGARYDHTAIWSGSVMVVWGGESLSQKLQTGSRYDPATDTWAATTTTNAPAARREHTAVWSGTVMIAWGGTAQNGSRLGTGGRYDPATDTWTATSTAAGVPTARYFHAAVWADTRMIVWGGRGGSNGTTTLGTGARYDPNLDSWTATATSATVPEARYRHTAVWSGAEMIVWGGFGSDYLKTGGRYVPATDSWLATSTGANSPSARAQHQAVWTGTRMIVFGGVATAGPGQTGGRYDPMTDTWQTTAITAATPSGRRYASAVWTGTEMIVWGGSPATNVGGRYNPTTDTWTATSTGANTPSARFSHSAVWTGNKMIVWGGTTGSTDFNTGGRYDPTTDTWLPTNTGTNVPVERSGASTAWTGEKMVVQGGVCEGCEFPWFDGGRYDPVADSWLETSVTQDTPGNYDRAQATVWSGKELIIWGGDGMSTGGRYDPPTDTWTPTAVTANTPTGRSYHSAVWTGTQMIVWGGSPMTSTGGIYCACLAPGTAYRDVDGDGYGDSGNSIATCDGGVPSGYVTVGGDCNDALGSVHPGATEICNGLDDDCNGPADDGIAAPSLVVGVSASRSDTDILMVWNAVPGASSYDTVKGGLSALRSGEGDFSAATTACLGDNLAARSAQDAEIPGVGEGLWYLVRADNCGGTGGYDDDSASQAAGRDAEIAASPNACP